MADYDLFKKAVLLLSPDDIKKVIQKRGERKIGEKRFLEGMKRGIEKLGGGKKEKEIKKDEMQTTLPPRTPPIN